MIYSGSMKKLILPFLLLLTGCSDSTKTATGIMFGNPTTAPWVIKEDLIPGPQVMESTPVVWHGSLLLVTWGRQANGTSLDIYDLATNTKIATTAFNLFYPSALVFNNTLYVFGTNGLTGTEVRVMSTVDLVQWTPQTHLFNAEPGQSIYNTSVAIDSTGFIMAYEVCENWFVCFHARFRHSTDLVNWTPIGGVLGGQYYTACPTIRYIGDTYYVFALADYGAKYATLLHKSNDLFSWETSPQAVVSYDGPDVNNNTSDLDLVDFQGNTEIVYSNGYQEEFSNYGPSGIRRAKYLGTIQQFVEEFFK